MKRIFRRTAALVLSLIFALTLSAAAFAANADAALITVSPGEATLSNTHIYIPVTIENKSEEVITLGSVINRTNSDSTVDWDGGNSVPAGGSIEILLRPTYASGQTGSITNTLVFSFTGDTSTNTVTKYVNITVTFPSTSDSLGGSGNAGDGTTESPNPPFRLSSYDEEGVLVPAPSGDAGKTVPVRIPLLCLRNNISNVTIAPVLSTSLDSFPFEIETLDYTLAMTGTLRRGSIVEFRYNGFKLNKLVTAGVKKVDFTISWSEDWGLTDERQSMTVSLYVNVEKGYEDDSGTEGGGTISKPKLILGSYSISAEKIYAGEQFDVTFTLRNTSSEEAVQNVQISISDTAEVGKLMPANNGSNTLYIDRIGRGETHTETISLQSAPDTEAKAYTLQLDFSYEGATNNAAYTATETIAVPILQKIRLKVDDPVVYDDPWVGQSCALYFALYNMGRAPIYNCMVDVEGDGLEMEETYFGGTVSAGSTMRADFTIIPSVGGDIAGEIVITYEDVYGEQMEERLPLTLFVNEEMMMDVPFTEDPGDMPGYEEPGISVIGGGEGGFPWLWVGIGVAVAAAAVIVIIVLKKKRAKELEDV